MASSIEQVTYEIPSHVELTVIRPNGQVEVVTHPTLKVISASQFAQIKDSTKKAGRGDVTTYKNVKKEVTSTIEMTDADKSYMASREIEKMSRMGE